MVSQQLLREGVGKSDGASFEKTDDFRMYLDKTVKTNRDILALAILAERSMCGYDLIKELLERYNVLMSPGAIYPLLYSLEETDS